MGLSKILAFCLLIFCLTLLVCSDANSDMCIDTIRLPNVLNFGNKTYFVDTNNKFNWINANLACKQYNMELVAIDTDEEFDFLLVYISRNGISSHIWTSGTDLGTEGQYKWLSNGRSIFSNRWHKNQPDNAGSAEHCIQFLNGDGTILLNDNKCDIKMGYICQSITKTYCAKQTYNEYEDSETCIDTIRLPNVLHLDNKTYFIDLNNKLNWINANLACKQYNMELVSIATDEEFDFLLTYISTMENNDQIWTSGTDLGTEGEYRWMSNANKIFSNRWHKKQPDIMDSEEHCIEFRKHLGKILLNDNTCETNKGYICQNISKMYCAKQTYSEC